MAHPTIFKRISDSDPQDKTSFLKFTTSLPPDILRDASKRLAICALVTAGFMLVWIVIYPLLPLLGESHAARPFDSNHLITFGMLALSIAVFFLARSERLKPRQTLDLGLLYMIVIAFIGGVAFRLAPGPLHIPSGWGISEICILILIFPVIIPNTPGKTLLTAVLMASMDPIGISLAVASGKSIPPGTELFTAILPNYLCAALALVPLYILNHLVRQVSHAREVGSYRLMELLGRGGMGEVWRANHRLLARDAAIKLVRPEVLVGKDAESQRVLLKRFEREAQATSLMCSPHTIDLYDFGISEDGTFYYVMELLSGFDLETLVQKFGPLRPARIVHLLCQVCDSLAEAHDAGLIHRDIKPANVYVCRYGRAVDFIKVLDFGLVKPRSDHEADETMLTGEHVAGGTPAFMAPEQVLGDRPVDARTDLYAVGCLGYWLLTGQPVFKGETPMKVMMHHVKSEPVPPSALAELRVPEALEKAILACLEKDPTGRPRDADVLAEALRACEPEDPWTPDRADDWWQAHVPGAARHIEI
jgi:serine/threonine-protein kinase